MQLMLDDRPREFMPIRAFRDTYQLPDSFGVNYFEPKNYTGLGSIEGAHRQLHDLRQAMLNHLPATVHIGDLLFLKDQLQALFETYLKGINAAIGLQIVEIDFAVAGFGDVLETWVYALVGHRSQSFTPPPNFEDIYQAWLNSTVRLSQTMHPYENNGDLWRVQIVNHVYGRAGLRVETADGVQYVEDGRLACPTENFMHHLLVEITTRLMNALQWA